MKRRKKADDYNYQTRALEFQVGDQVRLILGSDTDTGRVVEVYAAIGMLQIQWPNTSARHPVEDVQKINLGEAQFEAPKFQTVPGGMGTAQVSMGPPIDDIPINNVKPLVENVRRIDEIKKIAQAFVKKSLYWHGSNRQYRCKKSEIGSGNFLCPKRNCEGTLRNAIYKREDGQSVRLLACPECLFLIRRQDVIDNSACEEENEERMILASSIPSPFIREFVTEALKDRKYKEIAVFAEHSFDEDVDRYSALEQFIQNWSIPSPVSNEHEIMEDLFSEKVYQKIKRYDLDLVEVESFSTMEGIEIRGQIEGASYRGEVESSDPSDDYTKEIESVLRSLGPSKLNIEKRLEPDHRYGEITNLVWKFDLRWDLDLMQMEPPKEIQAAFLRGLER